MGLVDILVYGEEAGCLLGRFSGDGGRLGIAFGQARHQTMHGVHYLLYPDITYNHHGEIVGVIMVFHVAKNVVAADGADALRCAADWQPIGMHGVGLGHELLKQGNIGSILAHADLFQHHLFFPFQFPGIKSRVKHRVGKHLHGYWPVPGRKGGVVNRILVRGVGVYLPAYRFNGSGNFAGGAGGGAFEDHVLDEMGDARLFFLFVDAPRLDPELDGGHLGAGGLLDQNSQAVGKFVFVQVRGEFNSFGIGGSHGHTQEKKEEKE